MAQKTVVRLVDDLTGEPIEDGAGQTITFAFEGAQYEIDLSDENVDQLRKTIAPYLEAARRVSSSGRRARSSRVTAKADTEPDPRAVREWAQANGVEVSKRGRLSADVLGQYREAGN